MSRGEQSLVSRQIRAPSRYGNLAAGFIACAMVLGGGGSPSPLTETVLQLIFVAAVLFWLWWAPAGRSEPRGLPRSVLVFGCALLVIPLLQLIPLPPVLWQALPVRELVVASLEQVEAQDRWRPLSVSPSLTLSGLLALITAVGTMWGAAILPHTDRRTVIKAIALLSLIGAGLGALQMAGGPDAFRLYSTGHRGWLTAFHANRNAAADVLLIGSLALSAWYSGSKRSPARTRRVLPLFAIGQFVLLVAIVLTGSRAGIALVAVSLPFHGLMLLKPGDKMRSPGWFASAMIASLVLLILPIALSSNSRLSRVAGRFDVSSDARFPLWQDSLKAIEGFWPAGSGVGTFPVAFQPFESLENLDAGFANRAHNEYFEVFLEMGVLSVPLLVGGAIFLTIIIRRAFRISQHDNSSQIFACGTLAIVAIHSIVDYPLRNMTLACLAGVAVGLLASVPRSVSRSEQEGRDDLG